MCSQVSNLGPSWHSCLLPFSKSVQFVNQGHMVFVDIISPHVSTVVPYCNCIVNKDTCIKLMFWLFLHNRSITVSCAQGVIVRKCS